MRPTDCPNTPRRPRTVPGNLLWTLFAWAALTWMLLLDPSPATAGTVGIVPPAATACDPSVATCITPPSTCTPAEALQGQCSPGDSPPVGGQCTAGAAGDPGCSGAGPAAPSAGAGAGVMLSAGNPINLVSGNKYQQEVDLPKLPGVLGLELRRDYNSLSPYTGLMGAGWRMTYETVLYDLGGALQIVQPDGQRLMFQRGAGSSVAVCTSPQPGDGQVSILRDDRGRVTYSWRWPDGRVLVFGVGSGGGHPLQSITAPGGEQLSITYAPTGELVQVRDPQSRTLHFIYGAHGILRAVDTPVGRFDYTLDAQRRLVQVDHRPAAEAAPDRTRLYHYEHRYDGGHDNALTGISVRAVDPLTHESTQRRLSTYAYDINGRAILTTKGEPRRMRDGKQVEGTGIEQVDIAYVAKPLPTEGRPDATGEVQPRQLGKAVLTDSLGRKTEVLSAVIAGHFRLVQMSGPGCVTCGPGNMR